MPTHRPCPLPQAGYKANINRAATVRREEFPYVTAAISNAALSARTKKDRLVAFTAMRMTLLAHNPED